MKPSSNLYALAAALFAATATAAIPNLDWGLEIGAKISGSTLTVEQPANANRCLAWAYVDISQRLGENSGACFTFRVRGENVAEPTGANTGAKALVIVPLASGTLKYLQPKFPAGTFGWTNVSVHVSFLNAVPSNGVVRLALGIQNSTGKVVFDLDALSVTTESLGIERVNQDYIVRYPSAAGGASPSPLRGFNSPTRATTEADMRGMRALGARLVRFQIYRNWFAVDDNQDLDEYRSWVDSRLDNLADVLGWAAALDMKVAVDLHVVPGGRNSDREENLYHDARWLNAFVETWRRIATRFKGHPALYGYDLINEPTQRSPGDVASYWEAQRLAAEAIRAIDPDTAIIVESASAASAGAFSYLSPLAMDNVIYQFHTYSPLEFTHQGALDYPNLPNVSWPDASRGWNADYLRNAVRHVREFQLKHKCRIFVGEFAAIAWAGGADRYLRDCIDLFEEYGWDWAYHAFRASYEWDVEREGPVATQMAKVPMTPRKAALIDAMLYAPDIPWFSSVATNGNTAVIGGAWKDDADAAADFHAMMGREGVVRILSEVAPQCGILPCDLDDLLAKATAERDLAAVAFVDEGDDGPLTLRCLVSEDGVPTWRGLDGFSAERGAPCLAVAEIGCTGGVSRVRYAAASASGDAGTPPVLSRLRSQTGETWFPAAADAPAVAGRVAFSDRAAVSALVGTSSSAESDGDVFTVGSVTETCAADGRSGAVAVELLDTAPGIPDDFILRLTLHGASPGGSPSPATAVPLATIDLPFAGAGTYVFDTSGRLDAGTLAGGVLFRYVVALVSPSGQEVTQAASGTLRVAREVPWFSADAATWAVKGGRWAAAPQAADDAWRVSPGAPAIFSATSGRGGAPRVEVALPRLACQLECDLPDLLAETVADGDRAAIVAVEGDDGAMALHGLALVDGAPAWVKLGGAHSIMPAALRVVAEFNLSGGTPMVSYLAGGASRPGEPLSRLRSPSGSAWLPAIGPPGKLEGRVTISGSADVASIRGTVGLAAAEAEEYEARLRRATFMLLR